MSLIPVDGVSKFNKFFANEQGRDKFNKILQYGSRFLMYHYLIKEGPKSESSKSWGKMFALVRDSRKILRLFKFVSEYEKIAKILNNRPVSNKQLLQIIGAVGLSAYWFFDNLVFLAKGDRLKNNSEWSKYSMFGWFIGILAQLIIDSQAIIESLEREQKAKKSLTGTELTKVINTEQNLRVNLYKYSFPKNIPDLIISANGFNLPQKLVGTNFSDGFIGILGVISGSTVCCQVWNSIQ